MIDIPKIVAVLDAEHLLIAGRLVEADEESGRAELKNALASPPEPGPLAVANCSHVGRCALGSLLYATGRLSLYALSQMEAEPSEWSPGEVKLLTDAYGLERYHCEEIMGANDLDESEGETAMAARRRRVKDRIVWLAANSAFIESHADCRPKLQPICNANEKASSIEEGAGGNSL